MSSSPLQAQYAAGLSPSQISTYDKNGYLILPSFLSRLEISSLLHETDHLLSQIPLSTHPLTKFTTEESSSSEGHVGDDYFLTSGDKIRFFFEADAFSPTTGSLIRSPKLSINKIGHCLHELSPSFKTVTLNSKIASIAQGLGFRDPRVLQSMVICKQAGIGGAVPAHQDSEFLYTDPPSAVGFWIALEDAGTQNGGLRFAKGSHKRWPVRRRFVRKADGRSGTEFVTVWKGSKFPEGEEQQERSHETEGKKNEEEEEYTPEEVTAGTLVLIHGNLLHKSGKNTSEKSRFIYTFHLIEGKNVYDGRNWLQPAEGKGFSKLNDYAKG